MKVGLLGQHDVHFKSWKSDTKIGNLPLSPLYFITHNEKIAIYPSLWASAKMWMPSKPSDPLRCKTCRAIYILKEKSEIGN